MSDLKEGPISWEDAALIDDSYKDVLDREHMDHELEITERGTLRWKRDPELEQSLMNSFGAKDLNDLFMGGADKNDPKIRKLYKTMGYSLSGFWEVFYWEVNNEDAHKYRGRLTDEEYAWHILKTPEAEYE